MNNHFDFPNPTSFSTTDVQFALILEKCTYDEQGCLVLFCGVMAFSP